MYCFTRTPSTTSSPTIRMSFGRFSRLTRSRATIRAPHSNIANITRSAEQFRSMANGAICAITGNGHGNHRLRINRARIMGGSDIQIEIIVVRHMQMLLANMFVRFLNYHAHIIIHKILCYA